MSRLNRLRNDYASEIAETVEELAIMTPLREADLRSFSNEELKEMKTLALALDAAADDAGRQAAMLEHIGGATKLLSKLIGK